MKYLNEHLRIIVFNYILIILFIRKLNNTLLRTMFFIIKIVYKYLSLYTRLLFKKYIINLYIIILKSLIYINCLNENIIKKI